MKAWVIVIAGVLALAALPAQADRGHHHHFRPHVSFGVTYGHPFYYRPYRHYYPSSYYGSSYYGFEFGITPRYRTRRVRTEPAEVRARKLYVYPAAGQTESQLAEDRYECHVWAADGTGYDPTRGAGTAAEAADYSRALTACMEGRDYVVK